MDNSTRYAAINTKIKSLEGQLLNDEDYINLLTKKSVPEIAAYLKSKTHYKDILSGVDENEIHRGSLEGFLKESHVKCIEKIMHYFYDKYRELIKTMFIKYEIEDLKMVLRAIKTGGIERISRDSLVHIGRYSSINKDALLLSKDISDFIKNLKDTVYYDYLKLFVENADKISIFRIEMTLDLSYFDLFYKIINETDKEDRKILEYIQGTNVDLLNLQWIYRGLKFYNLTPEELFNYTIAYGKEFSRRDIKDFCYSKDVEEYQEKVLKTKYGFLFNHENTKDIFMERRILRYLYYKVINNLKKSVGMNISQVIAYMQLLEAEVRDIISIIEIVRYGIHVEEAKRFLIREI